MRRAGARCGPGLISVALAIGGCVPPGDGTEAPIDDAEGAVVVVPEVQPLLPPVHLPGRAPLYRPEDWGEPTGVVHTTTLVFSALDRNIDDFTGGFAVLDCDVDGDADLLLTAGDGANRIFVNDGLARFEPKPGAGVELPGQAVAGASAADWDRDGDHDVLLLVQHAQNRLLANDGACRFQDVTEDVGLDDENRSLFASWADLDRDGWLDLYVCNWGASVGEDHETVLGAPEPDRLWLSDGEGGFVDTTSHLPEDTRRSYGMKVGFLDQDGDRDQDLFLWNDKGSLAVPGRFFRNDGVSGSVVDLVDASEEVGFALAFDGMDLGFSDFDEDGDADILLTGSQETVLLDEGGFYIEAGAAVGIVDPVLNPFSWGLAVFDADGDGDQDAFFGRSAFFDEGPDHHDHYVGPAFYYRNEIPSGGLFDRDETVAALMGLHTWRGVAAADLNGDGFEDLVTTNADEEVRIFLANPPEDTGVVQVRLRGTRSNTEGRGAALSLRVGDRTLLRWPGSSDPYSTGVPTWTTFGLGREQAGGPLLVRWPSGALVEVTEVHAGERVTVVEPDGGET